METISKLKSTQFEEARFRFFYFEYDTFEDLTLTEVSKVSSQ